MSKSRVILLIEDNPADVRLIREALREFEPPIQIHPVPDGEQAMLFLQRRARFSDAPRPSLVFLDFNLPRTDSRELLRFIKKDPDLRSIPVAVLTSSSAEDVAREAYALEANCYLWKPSDLDTFFRTIRSASGYFLGLPD